MNLSPALSALWLIVGIVVIGFIYRHLIWSTIIAGVESFLIFGAGVWVLSLAWTWIKWKRRQARQKGSALERGPADEDVPDLAPVFASAAPEPASDVVDLVMAPDGTVRAQPQSPPSWPHRPATG